MSRRQQVTPIKKYKTIYKYAVGTVYMPIGATILDVQVQNGQPQIWALVDPNAEVEVRNIVMYATGEKIQGDPGVYIGTFQIYNTLNLVYHVFDKGI